MLITPITLRLNIYSLIMVLTLPTLVVGQPSDSSQLMLVPPEVKTKQTGAFSIQFDQDFFYVTPPSKNEDRNYSQGTAFTYSNPNMVEKFFLFYPLRKLNALIPDEVYGASITLGGTAFTPRIIDAEEPVVGDRPFSFLLYLSTSAIFKKDRGINKNDVFNSFRINYGIYGTRIGYQVQGWLHKNVVKGRPTDPIGWEHQISDGGAPALLLEYERFQSFTNSKKAKRIFDVGWGAGASVGYYDRIFGSVYGRLGKLNPQNQARWFWGFASTTSASFELENAATLSKQKVRKYEWFLYGKISPALTFRNAALVGQGFKHSDYTLEPEWTHVGGADFEWGFVVARESVKKHTAGQNARTIALLLRQVMRSPEFDSGIYPERWHFFGSAAIQFPL